MREPFRTSELPVIYRSASPFQASTSDKLRPHSVPTEPPLPLQILPKIAPLNTTLVSANPGHKSGPVLKKTGQPRLSVQA